MIRNKDSKSHIYIYSFLLALIINAAILAYANYEIIQKGVISLFTEDPAHPKPRRQIKLDQINFKNAEVNSRRVGIKNGAKINRPDIVPPPKPQLEKKGAPREQPLSLANLAPDLPKPVARAEKAGPSPFKIAKNFRPETASDKGGNFSFRYGKTTKEIPRSQEQEVLKTEASKDFSMPMNKATSKISNFEIRYERPEGVSEDELNSDEKAYYSFYVRSYKNYYSKIYANYDRIVVERPGLAKVFDSQHLLIGKIDYDEEGNIVTVKILKSSENDDLHYFFEETLKQMSQPNPPRFFTKAKKGFSIFYQLQIN